MNRGGRQHSVKASAAPGIDGVTWEKYGVELEANLSDLRKRVFSGRYRATPSKLVWIPKLDGSERPLGISVLEDPFKQTYRNIALGDDDFIQKINVKIKNQKSSREIPITNLPSSYNPKEIIQKVCAVNQKEHERLVNKERGNIYRSLALYLTRNIPH